MAKIQLSVKVKLDITEDGATKKSFNVTYRELSNRQQKEMGKDNKEILDLFKSNQSINRRIHALELEVDALDELKKHVDLLSATKKLGALYVKKDKLDEDFEKLGGYDKMLEASQVTFNKTVKGADVKDLVLWIEEESDYNEVLEAIITDAKEQKGKPQ